MRLLSLPLFACLAACGAIAHAAPKVALTAFVQEESFSNPRLSPDGKYLAVTVRVPTGAGRYTHTVTVYTLPERKIAGVFRMPVFHVPDGYIWAGKTRLAIVQSLSKSAPDQPAEGGEVVATEVDGSRQEYLYGPRTATAARRGERYGNDWANAYLQDLQHGPNNQVRLGVQPYDKQRSYLFDLDSAGATRTLLAEVPAKDMRFLAQHDDLPRIAFGVGDENQPIVYRYNDRVRGWEKQAGDFGKRYRPLHFSADNTEVAAFHSADGGPDQLIKENLATGARTTLLADPRGNVDTVMTGAQPGLAFGAHSGIGIPAPHYFDGGGDDAQLHKLLSSKFPDSYVSFVDFTRDGKTLLFKVASDRDPGEYFVFYRDGMRAEPLFAVRDTIDPDAMAERRPIAFKSRDGLDLHGYLTLPQRAPGARLPMVVLPHDGPHDTSDSWFFDRDAQFLASRGYAVLQVNFRGSGGRGINFEQSGYRQWGGAIQDDLVDGVKWAIAQGDVDGARVCSYGIGFGAYSALLLAAREPALFKCAAGLGGFYDLNLLYQSDDVRREKRPAEVYGKLIGTDPAELARFSPLTHAGRITAPVLLAHGEKDAVAPIAHARAMREALVAAQRAPEWLVAPDEGHGFYDPANVTLFYQKLEAFLGKHIGH